MNRVSQMPTKTENHIKMWAHTHKRRTVWILRGVHCSLCGSLNIWVCEKISSLKWKFLPNPPPHLIETSPSRSRPVLFPTVQFASLETFTVANFPSVLSECQLNFQSVTNFSSLERDKIRFTRLWITKLSRAGQVDCLYFDEFMRPEWFKMITGGWSTSKRRWKSFRNSS